MECVMTKAQNEKDWKGDSLMEKKPEIPKIADLFSISSNFPALFKHSQM
jgi:hypothetical protein